MTLLIQYRKKAFFSAFLFLSVAVFGQNPNRKFLRVQKGENSVEIFTNDGKYLFKPFTPEIIETSFIPSGEEYNPASHAVVLDPQKVDFVVKESDKAITIDTDGVDILVSKMPFQVNYFFDGQKLTSEKTGYSKGEGREKLDFNLTESEVLFGGGARALGMNRRGNRLELYNRAHYGYTTKSALMNYTLPIVLSSKKYALHFDNAPIGALDLDSEHNNTLTYETISGRKTYQLIAGDSWEDLVGNYTLLTGRQPIPPRWALGNFASRFGYHSQEEVEETIRKFKEDEIPVDAVIIDLYWFGHEIKGTMGNLAFVRDSFPQPKKMMQDLEKQGVKTILVTEPFILTTSNRWEEAVREKILATDSLQQPFTFDFYFGNTGLIDIFDPKAKEWFWNIYHELAEMGVDGWWGDLGEPEVHPEELVHATGTANEVHNIYGHYWAKMIYEGYAENYPKQRPFILMRAGAAGSQRFGLIPWSGDVSRSWGGLKPQPEIALQMGLQGLAYMHSDLGGFAGDLLDNELYVRWLQYGVFQPVFRPHAQEEVASEPVFKEPHTKALAKKAVELRYRLLPYNYTLSFRNSTEGLPLMRPLFFEEPDNFELYFVSDEYLWGDDILISPVLRPNIFEKEIYFPKTGNWFDFYTGEKYKGGNTATIELEEDHIPTFVRGGAFIPMAQPIMTTEDYSAEKVEIHYFFDEKVNSSKDVLYHDDGKLSEAYEKGHFEILILSSQKQNDSWVFTIEKQLGPEKKESDFESTTLVFHNVPFEPGLVQVNGKTARVRKNEKGEFFVPVPLNNKTSTITITQ